MEAVYLHPSHPHLWPFCSFAICPALAQLPLHTLVTSRLPGESYLDIFYEAFRIWINTEEVDHAAGFRGGGVYAVFAGSPFKSIVAVVNPN